MIKKFLYLLSFLLVASLPVQAQDVTDLNILDAVEDEMFLDPAVPTNRIQVLVDDGVVTLSGEVPSILDKERAMRLASTVRGVEMVINELEVDPIGEVTDEELEQRIIEALLINPATDAMEVRVDASEGAVEIRGVVESFQEKNLAEKVAKSVRGVREVINLIEVEYTSPRTDAEIAADIRQTLTWDALVDALGIQVTVDDAVVTLEGEVGSLAEKNRAIEDAWVMGVSSVNFENLTVDSELDGQEKTERQAVQTTDEDIRAAVNTALLIDPRVDALNVTTRVNDGVVTLRGTVDSLQAYNAAESVARSRLGVKRVKNRLRVMLAEDVEDKTTEARVHQALVNNPYVERYEIQISVIDGTAYLSGTVDSRFDRNQAELAASAVTGVTEVINNIDLDGRDEPYIYDPYVDLDYAPAILTYEYQPTVTLKSDSEIHEDVNDQMFWSPFVDANQVTVLVEDGIVTLTGRVDSYLERDAATENALEAGGVWVKNRLEVAEY